jgi:outer membrane protein
VAIDTKWIACASAAILAAAAAHARAQGAAVVEVDSVPTQIGLGVASVPDYKGSDDNKGALAPFFRYTFPDGYRYVSLVGPELSVNLLSSPRYRLGPVLNYVPARDSDVKDDVVKRMDKLDSTVEAGVFGELVFAEEANRRNRTIVGASYLTSSGRDRALLNARWWHQVAPQWDVQLGAGLVYGSSDYNNRYFGVNSGNRGSSGLADFAAGSGVNEYYATIGAVYYLDRNWMAVGGVKLAQISGDAKDSPLVKDRGDKSQGTFLLGAVYQWR